MLRSILLSNLVMLALLGLTDALPVNAQEMQGEGIEEASNESLPLSAPPLVPSPPLSDLNQPATTVTDWIAQIEASLVQITGVRVETTKAGLQVVLETYRWGA